MSNEALRKVAGLKEELARLPDSYDAMAAFWQRLLALPLPPQRPPAGGAAGRGRRPRAVAARD